jgi:hypothetical protein
VKKEENHLVVVEEEEEEDQVGEDEYLAGSPLPNGSASFTVTIPGDRVVKPASAGGGGVKHRTTSSGSGSGSSTPKQTSNRDSYKQSTGKLLKLSNCWTEIIMASEPPPLPSPPHSTTESVSSKAASPPPSSPGSSNSSHESNGSNTRTSAAAGSEGRNSNTPSPPAAAARLPSEENLYESLLRASYEQEQDADSLPSETLRSVSTWYSVQSDDDRKIPARPTEGMYEGTYREPIRRPYRPANNNNGSASSGLNSSFGNLMYSVRRHSISQSSETPPRPPRTSGSTVSQGSSSGAVAPAAASSTAAQAAASATASAKRTGETTYSGSSGSTEAASHETPPQSVVLPHKNHHNTSGTISSSSPVSRNGTDVTTVIEGSSLERELGLVGGGPCFGSRSPPAVVDEEEPYPPISSNSSYHSNRSSNISASGANSCRSEFQCLNAAAMLAQESNMGNMVETTRSIGNCNPCREGVEYREGGADYRVGIEVKEGGFGAVLAPTPCPAAAGGMMAGSTQSHASTQLPSGSVHSHHSGPRHHGNSQQSGRPSNTATTAKNINTNAGSSNNSTPHFGTSHRNNSTPHFGTSHRNNNPTSFNRPNRRSLEEDDDDDDESEHRHHPAPSEQLAMQMAFQNLAAGGTVGGNESLGGGSSTESAPGGDYTRMQQELGMTGQLPAAGIGSPHDLQHPSSSEDDPAADEQFKILAQIRAERERKEMELALKLSQEAIEREARRQAELDEDDYPSQFPKEPGSGNNDDDEDEALREALRISQEEAARAAQEPPEEDEDEFELALRLSEEQAKKDQERLQKLRETAGELSEEEQFRLAMEQSMEQEQRHQQNHGGSGDDDSESDEDIKLALRLSQAQIVTEQEEIQRQSVQKNLEYDYNGLHDHEEDYSESHHDDGGNDNVRDYFARGHHDDNDDLARLIQPLPTNAQPSPPLSHSPPSASLPQPPSMQQQPQQQHKAAAHKHHKFPLWNRLHQHRHREPIPTAGIPQAIPHLPPPPEDSEYLRSAHLYDAGMRRTLEEGENSSAAHRASSYDQELPPNPDGMSDDRFRHSFNEAKDDDPREAMVRQGQLETRQAILQGQSHIVTCRGCHGKLHAPRSCSLVFCPNCSTVSPGNDGNEEGGYDG